MHPDINAFISDAFYEGRLEPDAANEPQRSAPGEPLGGTGVRFVPARSGATGNRSTEEAEWVVAARSTRSSAGPGRIARVNARRLGIPDILVVAPYNAQVAEIARLAGERFG